MNCGYGDGGRSQTRTRAFDRIDRLCYRYLQMRTLSFRPFSFILIGTFLLLLQSTSVLAARITDVRFWSAPDHTRVVLDLTEPIEYESRSQEQPLQMNLELKGTLQTQRRELEVNDPFVKRIVLTNLGKDRVRMVFYQKKPLSTSFFPLKPYLDKPHRLVIDLVDVAQEKKEQEERQRQKEIRPKGLKTVVIDPGHGGEDPGAVGPFRTMEKDIALSVGQKVVHLLNQNQQIKAFLTRRGDYFVRLEDRTEIARQYGAELFVSLHTDGSFNPLSRGSSVYCLSLTGATDQAAKVLADKENLSNVLGGAFSRRTDLSKNPDLNRILFDLRQNDTMRESFRFAELILDDMKDVNRIKFASYRLANFVVLRAADIPSVLVEMAYITNKEDERLLNSDDFRGRLANTLAASIQRYFSQ